MRVITFIFCFIFCSFTVFSQKKVPYNPNKKFSPTELKDDFLWLREAIEGYHAGAFWYTPQDSLRSIFNNYEKTLTDSLTERQFRNQLYKVTEAVKCGHAGISSSRERQKYFKKKPVRILPFNLYYIDSQIVVIKNLTKDTTIKQGAIVKSIEGVAAKNIIKTMFEGNASDGFNLTNRYYAFEHGVQFEYTRHFSERDTFNIVFEDSSRVERSLKLAAIISDSFPFVKPKIVQSLYENRGNRFFRSEKDTTIAVLDLQAEKMLGYKKFYRKSFKYLKINKIDKLIIDLRGNGGGFLLNPGDLLGYMIASPDYVEVWRDRKPISMKKAIGGTRWIWFTEHFFPLLPSVRRVKTEDKKRFLLKIGFKPKRKNHFHGKVVVLTDGGTFSAASFIAAYLKKYQRATIIGQETGGGEAGCSAFLMPHVELPNSKLQYRLPLYRVIHNTAFDTVGRGVMPDILIQYNLDNYLKNKDLEMEKAIENLQKTP